MIRHVINATRGQTSRNILRIFAGSQYGGPVLQPAPRHTRTDDLEFDLVNMAAGKLNISGREQPKQQQQLLQQQEQQQIYKLPEYEQKTAILDPMSAFSSLELPSGMIIPKVQPEPETSRNQEITTPESATNIEKSCKSDLKQRRRHMNRHKLKKLRKRMKFVYMKLEQKKMRRKAVQLQQECDEIISKAKNWDALSEVKQDLELARKGGFGIDVFERKSL